MIGYPKVEIYIQLQRIYHPIPSILRIQFRDHSTQIIKIDGECNQDIMGKVMEEINN